jgi:hypothetical protein
VLLDFCSVVDKIYTSNVVCSFDVIVAVLLPELSNCVVVDFSCSGVAVLLTKPKVVEVNVASVVVSSICVVELSNVSSGVDEVLVGVNCGNVVCVIATDIEEDSCTTGVLLNKLTAVVDDRVEPCKFDEVVDGGPVLSGVSADETDENGVEKAVDETETLV